MIQLLVNELVKYGIAQGLIKEADKIIVTNRLLELLLCNEYKKSNTKCKSGMNHEMVEDILSYAINENCEGYLNY